METFRHYGRKYYGETHFLRVGVFPPKFGIKAAVNRGDLMPRRAEEIGIPAVSVAYAEGGGGHWGHAPPRFT
jgi:hypothetical protein